ncbi:hypothetical protein P3T16_004830 [Paraburkholderia sp. GAS42]|jgi:hypothetical protein
MVHKLATEAQQPVFRDQHETRRAPTENVGQQPAQLLFTVIQATAQVGDDLDVGETS